MNLLEALDKAIHAVPLLPRKLQGSWVDRLWEKVNGEKTPNFFYADMVY